VLDCLACGLVSGRGKNRNHNIVRSESHVSLAGATTTVLCVSCRVQVRRDTPSSLQGIILYAYVSEALNSSSFRTCLGNKKRFGFCPPSGDCCMNVGESFGTDWDNFGRHRVEWVED
jgi:hypothetical protein